MSEYAHLVALEVGSLVKLVAGGVHVFRVVEVDVDGDPDLGLVEYVEETPGTYPFIARLSRLVPTDE
ncbi:hypothetical protein [Nocardia miyunensis]|uniref:hypothetical protein n=1 Tax=Nocardia miyunensis TaxID=282684 RepID=UPI00082B540D|nr:hypothetical protein [Nocardia miyunensis]